jgi:hypothetical protein
MITSKQTRCQRFCWAYVSKYPYVSAPEIAGAQTDYTRREVLAALEQLEQLGLVARDKANIYNWVAVIPLVMQIPAWAV